MLKLIFKTSIQYKYIYKRIKTLKNSHYMTSISNTFNTKYPNIDLKSYTIDLNDLNDLNNFFEEFVKQYIYHVDSFFTKKASTDTIYYNDVAAHFKESNYRIAFRDICTEILSPIMRYTLFFNFELNGSNDLLVKTDHFNAKNVFRSDVKRISLTYDTVKNDKLDKIMDQDPNLENFTFIYNGEAHRYTDILMSLVKTPDNQLEKLIVLNNTFDISSSPGVFYNQTNIHTMMSPVLKSNRINMFRKCQNVIFLQLHNLYTAYKKIDKPGKPKFSDFCRLI